MGVRVFQKGQYYKGLDFIFPFSACFIWGLLLFFVFEMGDIKAILSSNS
jgi:hypothetical protein